MDFQSAMETFAEAWVAANSKGCPLSDLSVQVIFHCQYLCTLFGFFLINIELSLGIS